LNAKEVPSDKCYSKQQYEHGWSTYAPLCEEYQSPNLLSYGITYYEAIFNEAKAKRTRELILKMDSLMLAQRDLNEEFPHPCPAPPPSS
jgi:hypothetical protein